MYSGITAGLFEVVACHPEPGLITYQVQLNEQLSEGLSLGASVAIDGVCQTVAAIEGTRVTFQAMQETLEKTTLSTLQVGRLVSVERSLRYGDEIGGHESAGHVTGIAEVDAVISSENNLTLWFKVAPNCLPYLLSKGFVTLDGSSLTIGQVKAPNKFCVHLIPETLKRTNFAHKRAGDEVNLELCARTRAIVDTVQRCMATQVTQRS